MKIPKKQAKDLIDKILSKHPNIQDGLKLIDFIYARQCALIAVDLMLYHTGEDGSNIPLNNYYKEVKQELIDCK